jgi:hypothetical protein
MTIRCTRKLRKHLAVGKVSGVSGTATTVLGDWYANLLYTRRYRLIICVSDRTLLAVFVAAKNPAGFISRMQTSARSLLWALGVPSDAIEREMREMDKVALGAASNQSVLGSLRELALQARYALERHPDMDLLTLAIQVAETPCGAIKYQSPDRATLARLR